ncbi:MAG: MMPL family transporter [Vallitalea sp.]|jgi:predicted RND superfamily exporter protein|nr:MMPL family transporter [Vallitalea sp.]
MNKFASFVAKHRKIVLFIAILLMIPSFYGLVSTRVNYDLLTYLPEHLDSMKGQEIVDKVFHRASTGMLIVEDMESKDIIKLKEKIEQVEGVEKTTWISDAFDITTPKEFLPDDLKDIFYRENSTLIMIQFTNESSSDETQQAIKDIRGLLNKQCFLSGISAIIRDTIDLADRETPIYVLLAVVLATIVLALTLESTIVPVIFLMAIGMAILYNFGTNIFLGEISYVTKSLAAVLQLGVTMDFSIFLLHRYEEELTSNSNKEKAMADAIVKTASSIAGSSLTTIAGFLALAVMQLGLGKDIGFVMAKGVFIGVICTVTVLPALILTFDRVIHRFNHGTVLPSFNKSSNFITKHYKAFAVLFVLLFIPATYGKMNTDVYYNLDESLPRNLESIVALDKLKEEYNMTTTHMIVMSSETPSYKVKNMINEVEDLAGIEKVLGYDKLVGPGIPEEFVPKKIRDIVEKEGYKLLLVDSRFKAATDEQNNQLTLLNNIVKSYDENAMVTGEGALTKDLIELADIDFRNVSFASIIAVFLIILLVFRSLSIPVILVGVIELAIFINMGIPFYTNTTIPFVSSIVIGTIQLGATVDYAILLTTRFREEIRNGFDKIEAMKISLQGTIKSIVTSALTFFGATVGVGIIADMEMVKSLTGMISRGALISLLVIIFMLPSILILFEGVVAKTSRGWRQRTRLR